MTMKQVASYIEQRQGGYYIAGTRVSLDSIVYAFLRGQLPESIAQSFAPLSLEQVYGAITFYLANQDAIDQYLQEGKGELERLRQEARVKNPVLHSKLDQAKRGSLTPNG